FEAAKKLAEAAHVLGKEKDAITLRYLDTMREVSAGAGKTSIIFPVPLDLGSAIGKMLNK
ncbi:MAG: slipin family protein, partial [Halobacteriovoraceae bacterium]|nr:slipin family protein [Halobacteriovoraceae bacterium]